MTPGRTAQKPTLRVERAIQRSGHRLVAGMDEVGRGALAGPVSVGVVVVDEMSRSAPVGVKDSKLLSPKMRQRLVPRIHAWAKAYAVGHASPQEIDRHGIMVALRYAGTRALEALSVIPDLIILDGNYDWLTEPGQVALPGFADDGTDSCGPSPSGRSRTSGLSGPFGPGVPVRTMVKADMFCSSVAAASVLAKVERDAMMVELAVEVPGYSWELNKGYSAPEHFAALESYGSSVHHRRSWRLPGLGGWGGLAGVGETVPSGVKGVGIPEEPVMHDDGAVRTEAGGDR